MATADTDDPWIFDYIIVGAGVAGCVLANRLSRSGAFRVCLLEAGPRDRNFSIQLPGGVTRVRADRGFRWTPLVQSGTAADEPGRNVVLGRTLGGTSAINDFLYSRGQPEDYDGWEAAGNRGWSFADVLPYFRRSEHRIGPGDAAWRGRDGPLPITDSDWRHPLAAAFVGGLDAAGIPINTDYNGEHQAGVGRAQRWILNGWRHSAARAFLAPAMGRKHLTVLTEARVIGVIIENGKALGVAISAGPDQGVARMKARREVILAAGALHSPHLLMLSGVGDPAMLAARGVPVVHALPGVGANLQDGWTVPLVRAVQGAPTLNRSGQGWGRAVEFGRWILGRRGDLATSPTVASVFWRSTADDGRPDLQFDFRPGSWAPGADGDFAAVPGLTLAMRGLRPTSRGRVGLASTDPFAPPSVELDYLGTEADRAVAVAGLRLGQQWLATPGLARYIVAGRSTGANADGAVPTGAEAEGSSDADLLRYARMAGAPAGYFAGSCRMGPSDDPGAVVDPWLRVIGIDGLRIADASVMPTLPSGAPQAATMMIAEKAADLILGETPPSPEHPPRPR